MLKHYSDTDLGWDTETLRWISPKTNNIEEVKESKIIEPLELTEMDLDDGSKKEMVARFTDFHIDWIEREIPRYFYFLDFLREYKPNEAAQLDNLHTKWEFHKKRFFNNQDQYELFVDAIQEWTIKSLEAYERYAADIY